MTSVHNNLIESDVLIDVRNVSKCYHLYDRPQDRFLQSLFRGRKKFYRDFWALKDVSLQVRRGESVGIIGRNGAGKSTLLQLITGTLTPTSGDITVRGRVAALLQLGSGFNPEFTGRENVYLNGAILGFSRAQIEQRFDEIAAFADIGEFIEQPVKTYSSGMTVRLAFAVSVCLEPEILIVDEALSVGDAVFQFKCRNRLEDLIAKGTTLLFVSHDMGAVKAFCNRAIYLKEGTKEIEGLPEEVAESYFMDVHSEQTRSVGRAGSEMITPIAYKVAGGYGTAEGEILSARFVSPSGDSSVFNPEDTVELAVDVRLIAAVKYPCLSVVLQTSKLIGIGGKRIRLDKAKWSDDKLRVCISLPVTLNEGKYFITLRLEDGLGDKNLFLIHKIPGALSFDVLKSKNDDLLGHCDLAITHGYL